MVCDCDEHCSEFSHCMCVSYPDTPGSCECDCWGPIVLLPSAPKIKNRTAGSEFGLCIKNADLGALGEFLSKRFDVPILIPADRMRAAVSLKIERTTLADVAKSTGLVLGAAAGGGKAAS